MGIFGHATCLDRAAPASPSCCPRHNLLRQAQRTANDGVRNAIPEVKTHSSGMKEALIHSPSVGAAFLISKLFNVTVEGVFHWRPTSAAEHSHLA